MHARQIWLPQLSGPLSSGRRLICVNDWREWFVTRGNSDSPWYIGLSGLVDNESDAVDFAGSGPAGPQGPAGATGPQGPQGNAGSTGATGPAGLGTVAPSTPARTLNSTFQPDASKAVLCSYSVRTQVTNPLLAGSSTATVTLLSDASNPPTTERCRVEAISSVGVAVAIALTTANTAPLSYIAPPGHFVRLVSSTSGTASTSIISQAEEALG